MSGGGSPTHLLSCCIYLLGVTLPILSFLTFQNLFALYVFIQNIVEFCFVVSSKKIFLLLGELSPFIFIDKNYGLSFFILFYALFAIFIFHILLSLRLMFFHILTFMKSKCVFQVMVF